MSKVKVQYQNTYPGKDTRLPGLVWEPGEIKELEEKDAKELCKNTDFMLLDSLEFKTVKKKKKIKEEE